MPHQCVACGEIFGDGASEILKGCSKCGKRLFFYVKKEKIEEAKNRVLELSDDEKEHIEKDVFDIIGGKDNNEPVVLDFEAVLVSGAGKYELDLVKVFNNKHLIYKVGDGKYMIDIAETFKRHGGKE
jgi:predicted  nucleic acid-binding Zn-ribbon protein